MAEASKKAASDDKAKPESEKVVDFDPYLGGDRDDEEEMSDEEHAILRGDDPTDDGVEVADEEESKEQQKADAEAGVKEGEDKGKEADDTDAETKTPDDADADSKPDDSDKDEVVDDSTKDVHTDVDESDAESEDKPDSGIQIPKGRLDKEVARRREVEATLARLQEKGVEVTPTTKVELDPEIDAGLMKKIQTAGLDGDDEAFASGMTAFAKSIAQQTAEAVETRMRGEMSGIAEEATTARAAKDRAGELMDRFPFLDASSEDHNQDAVNEVLAIQSGYVRIPGYTPTSALEEATDLIVRKYHPELLEQSSTDDDPDPAPKAETVLATKVKDEERRTAQVKKNVGALKQPPVVKSEGGEEILEMDVASMSEEEFEALPESKLRELRGDLVT